MLDPAGIEIAVRAGFNETSPSVAFDGTNYLVVWQEIPCNRILGRRVSQDGVPDGDGSFLISDCSEPEGKGSQGEVWIRKFDPAVAFDGVNYLVTWVDFYGNLAGYYENIAACPRDPRGTVLDTHRPQQRGVVQIPRVAVAGLRRLDVPRRLDRRRGGPWGPRHARGIRARSNGFTMSAVWGSLPRERLRRDELPRSSGTTGSMSSGRA